MTQAPVSLDEFRQHLNLGATEERDSDDELWATVLAATRMVEADAGAIRIRQESETVDLPCQYVAGVTVLHLAKWPLFELVSVTASQPSSDPVWFPWFRYDVVYTVGRDPIPDDLILAVLLQGGLLWGSQRGPDSVRRWTAMQGAGYSSPGGIDRNRLKDVLAAYRVPAVA